MAEQLQLQLVPPFKVVGPVHRVSFDPEGHRMLLWHSEAVDVTDPSMFTGLDTYETEYLLGWVRREMGREVERRRGRDLGEPQRYDEGELRGTAWDGLANNDREALAHHIMKLLGWETLDSDPHGEHGLAWTLCELAGWPS